MIKRLFIILAAVLLLAGCDQKPKVLADLNGNPVDLQDYRGKWVVINYWASWCKHCLKELPALNEFYETHKDKVIVFGVNYDHLPAEQLKPLVQKLNIKFPMLVVDPAKELGIGQIDTIPIIYLIAPNGEMSQPIMGEQAISSLQTITGLKLKSVDNSLG